MTPNLDGRLEDLISKASEAVSAAVTAMEHTNRKLVELLQVRASRPWSADELATYLDLSRRERAAHRQYLAGRNWFDSARRRRAEQAIRPHRDAKRLDVGNDGSARTRSLGS